jgi:RNA polymerase-binding transcription factor DksA
VTPPTPDRQHDATHLIAAARADTERLVGSLTRQWDSIVAGSEHTTNDDEHDPEGATVAFERAQVQDLLQQARTDLIDLDTADTRVHSGAYWVCERCGGPIAETRLAARPTTRICITCANKIRR